MTTTMELWLAWMRRWMAAANSFAEAQHTAFKELTPMLTRETEAAAAVVEQGAAELRRAGRRAAAASAEGAEVVALGTAAGNKPTPPPSRRPRGRPRRETKSK